jgi:iron complex outermembrane recepter protein
MTAKYTGRFTVAIISALVGTAAMAAETTSDNDTLLGEVVITAQKRSERLLDVPMSVAAISGDELAAAVVGSSMDLGQVTPGLLVSAIGTGYIPAIRGVSSSGTSPGDESNVALYIDDIYVGDTLAGMFDLPDIERIEVLKGPQGTLFGRNATGGAIRIVTRAPSFDKHGSVSGDYGFNFGETKLNAYITGPVSDRVAASLSAATRNGDGYVDGIAQNTGKTYGGPHNYTVRGKLLFKVSDRLQMTLIADSSKTDSESAALPSALNQNPFPGAGSVANAPFQYAGSTQPKQIVKTYSASLDASFKATDAVTVRSITAYRNFKLNYQVDIDRTNQPLSGLALHANQQNLSQEFNIFGPGGGYFDWLVGAFFYGSSAGNPNFSNYSNALGGSGDAPGGADIADFWNSEKTSAYAGFADLTWNFSSKWHATLGGRYSSETKTFHFQDIIRLAGIRPPTDAKTTWSSPTYRGVLRYDFNPDANVYLSLSNGFKSGVYNTFTNLNVPADPEKIDALEIGAKARLASGLLLTGAVYAYNYKDIQVQAQTLVGGIPLLTLTNAAEARIRGAEVSAEGSMGRHFSFNVGVGYEPTAEYSNFPKAQVTIPINTPPIVGLQVVPYDASGSRIIKAPEWTANVRLTYTADVMDGKLSASVNSAYNSSFFWQAANLTRAASKNILNARLSWTDPKDRYTFSAWGTNLSNQIYSTYSSPNTRGDTETWAQPRQVGVGVAMKF